MVLLGGSDIANFIGILRKRFISVSGVKVFNIARTVIVKTTISGDTVIEYLFATIYDNRSMTQNKWKLMYP